MMGALEVMMDVLTVKFQPAGLVTGIYPTNFLFAKFFQFVVMEK